ncbi:hypothetical protein LSH36_277g03084, partial [Paralvinella palmiformis]
NAMATIELRVQNPMTHTTANGKFTSYLIYIEKHILFHSTPPPLPPKTFFRDRFDPELIEYRKAGLELFLHGDNVVHLFLQSPLSIEAIDGVIKQPQGQSVATIITEHAQQAQGICQDCHRELYPTGTNAKGVPCDEVSNITQQTCPHDIFSPTRPHSFDFSHCIMGQSMSYDSADEPNHLANMAANTSQD